MQKFSAKKLSAWTEGLGMKAEQKYFQNYNHGYLLHNGCALPITSQWPPSSSSQNSSWKNASIIM